MDAVDEGGGEVGLRVGGGRGEGEEEGVEGGDAGLVVAGVTTSRAVSVVICGNTSWAASVSPVQWDTGCSGAYGRKPPGRNFTPQTRPRPVSFLV